MSKYTIKMKCSCGAEIKQNSSSDAFDDGGRIVGDWMAKHRHCSERSGNGGKTALGTINECWEAINEKIQHGTLTGTGADKTAERNGLILAANVIAEMRIKAAEGGAE